MRSSAAVVCILLVASCAFAQQSPASAESPTAQAADASGALAQNPQPGTTPTTATTPAANDPSQTSSNSQAPANVGAKPGKQPKRILGVMPNFRAVSAGETPPPPTPKHAFKIATQNSFDYSSFIFVGITSAMAEWSDSHPQLGEGMAGYGRYYWRGFVDKTDGNYLVIFALPSVLHEDERYYAMGEGSVWKRGTYAATRIFITPNYSHHNTANIAELLGRAAAQAISVSYYPSKTRTPGAIGEKYAFSLGRDALTNTFREFWPDIAVHVLHRHP